MKAAVKAVAACCALAVLLHAGEGRAQTYPDRPVRFIVPNPAGGSNDGAARILAYALGERWPHPVVIENRGGGGGNVGAQAAAVAPADGYTLLLTSPGPLTINPSLYKHLPFDAEKDFAPIALVATPPSLPQDFTPDLATARRIVQGALRERGSGDACLWLDPIEITALMKAYAIPVTPALLACDAEEAAKVAAPLLADGSTVVAKILSPDIVHKSEVGGVRLNLTSERAVRDAVAGIVARARAVRPDARITGVTIHPMILRPKARELIAGIADDPTFGPIIAFGRGGTAVEVINDKALALPPLDLKMAQELIARTRVARVLKAYRDVPAADEAAVALVLVKLAQMATDLPEVREVDLNPILADKDCVIAVDARVAVAPVQPGARAHQRCAVRPYPKEWERQVALRDGTAILIRPVRPEDEPLYGPFLSGVTAQDLRLRFFAPVKDFGHRFVARFTQIDYARAMAFIAIEEASGRMLGVVRLHADANYETGEYAILLRSDLKGRGLGWLLMQLIIEYGRAEGLKSIEGQVLSENATMLAMCRELGFEIVADAEEPDIFVVKLALGH